MIVSHKHKLIFVKTHKTATQTFLKFIKPHLGPDDVMAGDKEEIIKGEIVNENTKLNIDKKFDSTGICAEDYQQIYGNHLPWFMIKRIVGDDIWNEYTKFTIERDPFDRILSLFFFLNPLIFGNDLVVSQNYREEVEKYQKNNWEIYKNLPFHEKPIGKMVAWQEQNTLATAYPDEIRSYFEEWALVQLEAETQPLMDDLVYGVSPHVENPYVQKELNMYKATAEKFKLTGFLKLYNLQPAWINPNNNIPFMNFPYIDELKTITLHNYYRDGSHILGQCRFLNYGNYFDGENLQVDHVVDFKNVGDNIGKFFNKYDIGIKCDKNLYDAATQNAHYRKNLKGKQPKEWWYNGPRGEWVHKVIKRRFYNDNMNDNQINFNKIISG